MKVLIVDDHALFREGLSHVLLEMDEHVEILGAAGIDSALELANSHMDIDLVLLDLNLPGESGFTVLELFSVRYPATPVVILSASNHHSDIQRSLDCGAMGYIQKDTTSVVMLNALRMILSGGVYVPPIFTQQKSDGKSTDNKPLLTQRQLQVLEMIVLGHSNKVIAANLSLAEATVKMHVTSIMKCLGVTNRTQAALEAKKIGLWAD